jgi:hypothetical protein
VTRVVNRCIWIIFAAQAVLCIVNVVCWVVWPAMMKSDFSLYFDPESSKALPKAGESQGALQVFEQFLTFFIL